MGYLAWFCWVRLPGGVCYKCGPEIPNHTLEYLTFHMGSLNCQLHKTHSRYSEMKCFSSFLHWRIYSAVFRYYNKMPQDGNIYLKKSFWLTVQEVQSQKPTSVIIFFPTEPQVGLQQQMAEDKQRAYVCLFSLPWSHQYNHKGSIFILKHVPKISPLTP